MERRYNARRKFGRYLIRSSILYFPTFQRKANRNNKRFCSLKYSVCKSKVCYVLPLNLFGFCGNKTMSGYAYGAHLRYSTIVHSSLVNYRLGFGERVGKQAYTICTAPLQFMSHSIRRQNVSHRFHRTVTSTSVDGETLCAKQQLPNVWVQRKLQLAGSNLFFCKRYYIV